MFTLNDARAEMDRLDKISGLNTRGISLVLSLRMTVNYGVCRWRKQNGKYHACEIGFSDRLFQYGTQEHCLDVVRHEYAHLYAIEKHQCLGHGAKWKAAAKMFGCDPTAAGVYPEVPDAELKSGSPKKEYVVICQQCKTQSVYQRQLQWIRAIQEGKKSAATCRTCGASDFTVEVRLASNQN